MGEILTPAQKRALIKITDYKWHSSKAIAEGLPTLRNLVKRGLMECKTLPDTDVIMFRKKRI